MKTREEIQAKIEELEDDILNIEYSGLVTAREFFVKEKEESDLQAKIELLQWVLE